jgi:hypothetical protein
MLCVGSARLSSSVRNHVRDSSIKIPPELEIALRQKIYFVFSVTQCGTKAPNTDIVTISGRHSSKRTVSFEYVCCLGVAELLLQIRCSTNPDSFGLY